MTSLRSRSTPEGIAAAVNAVLVVLIPATLVTVGTLNANAAYPRFSAGARVVRAVAPFLVTAAVMTPFALLAAWRTFVHAKRYRERSFAWWAVFEPSALGFTIAFLIVLRAAAPRLVETFWLAVAYVTAYAVLGFLVGLPFGIILCIAGVIVLWLNDVEPPRHKASPIES